MRTIDNTTRQLLTNPTKRWAWIIYQLNLVGSSLAAVATQNDVSRQLLYQAARRPYPRMESLIADALGMAPRELFPERYDADGLPIRKPMGRPKKSDTKIPNNTRAKAGRNGKSARVA